MRRGPRKLPDLGLGEGAEPEIVEQGEDDDAEPLTDEQLGLTARPVGHPLPIPGNEVVRLEPHPPAVVPTQGRAGVRALAQRYTVQAINALVRKLKDRDSRVVVAAAAQLLARGWGSPSIEGKGPGDEGDGGTGPAEMQARLAALERLQQNPEYMEQLITIMRGSGQVKDPNAPAEVAAPPEEELVQQLVEEPEPEEAIEVEVVRDVCYCGCSYDEHPSGGQCNSCVRCHLYTSRDAELGRRRAIEDGTTN